MLTSRSEWIIHSHRRRVLRHSRKAHNLATLNKVILPIIQRVMPHAFAAELLNEQPMPCPSIETLLKRVEDEARKYGLTNRRSKR